MQITKVFINRFQDEKLKALATVTIDDCLNLTGIKVMEGVNGLFISMPSRKGKEGEKDDKGKQKYYDIFYPKTKEFREQLVNAVLGEYNGQTTTTADVDGFVELDDSDTLPF